jgi:hypothetical protein
MDCWRRPKFDPAPTPKGFGRIRLRRISKASAQYLIPFVQDGIEPGAQVRTDGAGVYKPLRI